VHALGQLGRGPGRVIVCTPSGNFGNLTAGLMAKRAGLPVERFIAATNVNDVVPVYLETGRFEPRASIQTIANAMDVGHPSNFERMLWLYGNDLDAMRRDVVGTRHTDGQVRAAIRRVFEERGYLLDPHSAIAYLGLTRFLRGSARGHAEPGDEASASERAGGGSPAPVRNADATQGIFLATAHPAKFREIVEPVLGRTIDTPAPLADALARPRHILRLEASLDALTTVLES
jgi:threonine synthase